jgi:hypothetical protein
VEEVFGEQEISIEQRAVDYVNAMFKSLHVLSCMVVGKIHVNNPFSGRTSRKRLIWKISAKFVNMGEHRRSTSEEVEC